MPTVSSRTPEGSPGRCPFCEREVQLESSLPFGDAPCPYCGSLIRFVNLGGELHLLDQAGERSLRRKLRRYLAEQLGVDERKIGDEIETLQQLKLDSLDTIELIMDLEEEGDDFSGR
jgi:acyl carrier protein